MGVILLIIIVFVILQIMGAWRLGGGISDWIENEEDKKKKRGKK